MLVHTKLCHTARFGHLEWRQTLTLATRFLSSNQSSHSWRSAVRDAQGVRAACDKKQNRAGWQRKQSSFLHLSITLCCSGWLSSLGSLWLGFITPPPRPLALASPLCLGLRSFGRVPLRCLDFLLIWGATQSSPSKKQDSEDSFCFYLFANDI